MVHKYINELVELYFSDFIEILFDSGMKISLSAVAAISEGVQTYVKNLMDNALENRSCRLNESTRGPFGALSRMIATGQGDPLPDNLKNVALVWSSKDVRTVLEDEEKNAKRSFLSFSATEEKELVREMRSLDDMYLTKRKAYSMLANTPENYWWLREVRKPYWSNSLTFFFLFLIILYFVFAMEMG